MSRDARVAVSLCLCFVIAGCHANRGAGIKDTAYRSTPPALSGTVVKASVVELTLQPLEKPGEKVTVGIAADTSIVTETGGSWPREQAMVGLTAKVWLQEGSGQKGRAPLVAAVIQLGK